MPDNNIAKGCIIAAIVVASFGVFIAIAIVLCGIISSIAIPTYVKKANKAKNQIVIERIDMAEAEVTRLLKEKLQKDYIASEAIVNLLANGTPVNKTDNLKSPFDKDLNGFSNDKNPGVVTIYYDKENDEYIITGYDKKKKPLKTIIVEGSNNGNE